MTDTTPTSIPTLSFAHEGAVHSPFSGEVVIGEDGPTGTDPTVLLAFCGNAGNYYFIGDAVLAAAGIDLEDAETLEPQELLVQAGIEGAIAFEVDMGWNGVDLYAFAPQRDDVG